MLINLKTAKTLGLTIRQAVRLQVDHIIEICFPFVDAGVMAWHRRLPAG